MQDMDYVGTDMEDTIPQHENGGELFKPGTSDDDNPAEEGAVTDETQSSEEGAQKPKRRTRKKADEPPPDTVQDEPGQAEEPSAGLDSDQSSPDEPDGDFSQEDTDEVSAAPRRRERGLDSQGRVIYERSDTGQRELNMLSAARNARTILTTTIDSIDPDGNSMPRVAFHVGPVKVMIPFKEMGLDLNPESIKPDEYVAIINSMLGSTVDYMVLGVDVHNRLAGASRRAAMLLRRRTILNARMGGDFRIKLGTIATARVLQVRRLSALVEVYGYQTYIGRGAASDLWVNDVRDVVKPGEEKQVEVVELERDPQTKEVTHLAVSIRGAKDTDGFELQVGNIYSGYITGTSETAYFVQVANTEIEVRCPIKSNFVMESLHTGDFVKIKIPGIYEGRPTGSIRRIIKKAAAGTR